MARPSPQTQAKRRREQAKKEKRKAKEEKKALRKAIKAGEVDENGVPFATGDTLPDDSDAGTDSLPDTPDAPATADDKPGAPRIDSPSD